MNLIIYTRRGGNARHFDLAHPLALVGITVLFAALIAGVFQLGMRASDHGWFRAKSVDAVGARLAEREAEIVALKQQLQDRTDALSLRLGQLNAQMLRLNAVGKRLTESANISSREFNFDQAPPQGGPEELESLHTGRGADLGDLTDGIERFDRSLSLRGAQYSALETVLLGRQLTTEIRPSGRPVHAGYISSAFGERMDPFNGEEAFHKGVDFAARAGDDVLAVATGVVTQALKRSGYGVLVELNHGGGYVTRYAHNERAMVQVGDTVERGQVVAIVGSTGRSTGPHVHFEVLKNGAAINPISFLGN